MPYELEDSGNLISSIHTLGIVEDVQYTEEGVYIQGQVPQFLHRQILRAIEQGTDTRYDASDENESINRDDADIVWVAIAKGRHDHHGDVSSSTTSSDDKEYKHANVDKKRHRNLEMEMETEEVLEMERQGLSTNLVDWEMDEGDYE